MMKILTSILIVFTLAACAPTSLGKLAQAESAMVALSRTVREACLESRAQGWQPLSEHTCRQAAAAYLVADKAGDLARQALKRNPDDSIAPFLADIASYVLNVVGWIEKAGVPIPKKVADFVNAARGGM